MGHNLRGALVGNALRTATQTTSRQPTVVVIGSGLAGLSAAISDAEAQDPTVQVVVLEKNNKLGGNSAKATSGINSVNIGARDSINRFVEDTIKAGHNSGNLELATLMASKSREALSWLNDRVGGEGLTNCVRGGGHSVPRTLRFSPGDDGRPRPVGWTLIAALTKEALSKPNIRVLKGIECTGIIMDEKSNTVKGVRYRRVGSESVLAEDEELYSDSIVLASGGFAASVELLKKYAPNLAELPTTNGPWATGDGLRIAEKVGAKTRDLMHVQVHPTGFLNPSNPSNKSVFLAPEALRACGGLLISPRTGKRFANELLPRDLLSEAIFENGLPLEEWDKKHNPSSSTKDVCDSTERKGEEELVTKGRNGEKSQDDGDKKKRRITVVAMILSEKVIEAFGLTAARFYQKIGLMQAHNNLDEASASLKIPIKTLRRELMTYAAFGSTRDVMKKEKEGGGGQARTDEFGKDYFPEADSYTSLGKCWTAWITPTLHYCMGGVVFNTKGEVIASQNDHPIKGLYGAGEIVGGIHGENRLVGNSLLECVVFGIISGKQARAFSLEQRR